MYSILKGNVKNIFPEKKIYSTLRNLNKKYFVINILYFKYLFLNCFSPTAYIKI